MAGGGTFAMVERSLRVETRMIRTHVVRLAFAGLILWTLVRIHNELHYYSSPGMRFFEEICYVNFALLNLAGMSFFSTVITEEKEEMTLGLLRMAGISPLGILGGKLLPRLISSVALLSVQLPFTFLAITLGGVTSHQIIAAYVALLAYTVFLAGLGTFFSTICMRSNLAAALTTSTLAAFFIVTVAGPRVILQFARRLSLGRGIVSRIDAMLNALKDCSPYEALLSILETGFSSSVISVQVASNTLLGLALIGGAWALFDRCTRNERTVAPARGLVALFSKRLAGQDEQKRVWNQALVWKDYYFATGGTTAIVIKLISYVSLMTALGSYLIRRVTSSPADTIGGMCVLSMGTALVVELPIYFSRLFREEIRWQTWAGLMLLPDPVWKVAWQKILGILPTFLPAMMIMVFGLYMAPRWRHDLLEFLTEPLGWFVIMQYVMGLALVVLLSLIVKWGALPLGIAIVAAGNFIYVACFGPRFGGVEAVVGIFLAIIGTSVLIALIGDRLQSLASR